jgi:hypothetical protein
LTKKHEYRNVSHHGIFVPARLVVAKEGYAMVRRKGSTPFIVAEAEWTAATSVATEAVGREAVKTGLVIGSLIATVFIAAVFCKLPSDARLVEKAAVVLMGGAFVALSMMIFGERGQS